MTKELAIFIKETELSVFFWDGDKYTNQKIKGESLQKYSQLDESLEEIATYLKRVLPCESYSEYSVVLFVSLLQKIDTKKIETIFHGGSIRYLALELVQAYQHVLKVEYGEKEKQLEEDLKKRTEEIVQLKQQLKKSDQQLKDLQEKRDQDQKTITQLEVKAKKFDANELLRKTANRVLVTLDIAYSDPSDFNSRIDPLLRPLIGKTDLKTTVEFQHADGAAVKKHSKILHVNTEFGLGEDKHSPIDGFLYTLGPKQSGEVKINKFKLENDAHIALAVISSSPNELDSDIIKFAKTELKK